MLLAGLAANAQDPPLPESTVRVLVVVQPDLQEIVRKAAGTAIPTMIMVVPGEPGAERHDFRIELSFSSAVDNSGQRSNRDGAIILGPAGWLVGSITPWSCPTVHRLQAIVMNNGGGTLSTIEVTREQKRVGTMLKCSKVSTPNDSIVSEMSVEFLQRFRSEWFLPEPDAAPPPVIEPSTEESWIG